MPRRAWIIVGALMLLTLGVLWIVVRGPRTLDPVYEGRPLSQWLSPGYFYTPASSGPSRLWTTTNEKGDEAVRALGTNSLPVLLALLAARDNPLQTRYYAWLQRHPTWHRPPYPARQKNERALAGLAALGPPAVAAVPALAAMVVRPSNPTGQMNALFALSRLGTNAAGALPQLTAALADPHPLVRAGAAACLGGLGSHAAPAIPALCHLRDTSPVNIRVPLYLTPSTINEFLAWSRGPTPPPDPCRATAIRALELIVPATEPLAAAQR